ncbi:hypothetical protein BU25DRAFT_420158 [Macroventuria anomochaeta]|uniref:Uncharacterized protein n=1 Tax=Macroventuria anomochaeta TaxID=301207 RepID=A0ACB6S5F9_9PLEO|nr:uncharacterized protein BU25DRAFT_420158 [Macroventuria anomochaeta]KAF2629284.1 hypothetical protein BU25DRAFT_420158 [Macroventuria anomochaeta]
MKDIPIIRKMMPDGQTHPYQIWSAMSVNSALGQVCLDAGYTEPVTTYSFRRGVANNMEATASSKSTKEALGHKSDRVWHSYAAPVVSVDGQNIAYGKPEDASHARFTQSIAVTRDFGAPKPSGTQLGMSSVVFEDAISRAKSDKKPLTDRATYRKALRLQHKMERDEYATRLRTVVQTLHHHSGVRSLQQFSGRCSSTTLFRHRSLKPFGLQTMLLLENASDL